MRIICAKIALHKPTRLLGGLTPCEFMRVYWQRKLLLIRQAFPDACAPLEAAALFALAARGDVESRLITRRGARWQLRQGPFEPGSLPSLHRRGWTLLVQGVNLHDEGADRLRRQFRFLPDARLDDVMISYATDGGGVGPHIDSYDVFLLQAQGQRRWRIAAQQDLTLRADAPLKLLQHFDAQQEWILKAGDMLYLPPHIAHDGIALGACMTCSIGFRAPLAGELLEQFFYHLAERACAAPRAGRRYADAGARPTDTPARLPERLTDYLGAIIAAQRWSRNDVSRFLGEYLSEPKAQVYFDPPKRPMSERAFSGQILRDGVVLDRKTVLMYDRRRYYINGEAQILSSDLRKWLKELADKRELKAETFVTLPNDSTMTGLLQEWYRAGWIWPGRA